MGWMPHQNYQDSLPVTSDQLLQQLDEQGLSYMRIDHIPLCTVADLKQVEMAFRSQPKGAGILKTCICVIRKRIIIWWCCKKMT